MPIDQQTIEQSIIGKRIVAIGWLSSAIPEGAFELESITLEGGVTLKLFAWLTTFGGRIFAEIVDGSQINARCVCPLCNQGHDPKLIGNSGEGKDKFRHGDGPGGGGGYSLRQIGRY